LKIVLAVFVQVYIFGLVDSEKLMVDGAGGGWKGRGLRPGRHWPPGVFFDIKFGSGASGLGSGREAQGALVAGNVAAAGMLAPWFPADRQVRPTATRSCPGISTDWSRAGRAIRPAGSAENQGYPG
jgi:hypothetical protein